MSKQRGTKLVWVAVILAACVVAVPVGWVAYEPVKEWLFSSPELEQTIDDFVVVQPDAAEPVEAPPVESN